MSEFSEQVDAAAAAKEKKLKDYERPLFLVCAICGLGPFALPFILRHPRIRWYWKLCITLAVIALTWGCIVLTKVMWDIIREQWQIIQELRS